VTIYSQPLGLSDFQIELVKRAAKAVPIEKRDEFLLSAPRHLAPEPSDFAVSVAVNRALDILPAREDSIR
jgi:uncharacterized protein (DUF1778 family)